MQRRGKQVSAATNKHATREEVVLPIWPLLGNGSVMKLPRETYRQATDQPLE
jgi:hypothetical protein